jgi:hypothetical protein
MPAVNGLPRSTRLPSAGSVSLLVAGFDLSWRFIVGIGLTLAVPHVLADWWEHPHDKWYLKDDWKGAAVARYAPIIKLENPAASGWIVIWGDQGVELTVNGTHVMQRVDRGLIYDADLTPFVKGAAEVRLRCGPAKIVAEGELVDVQGQRYPFASGCDWPVPVAPGTKLPPAAKPHRPGESSGAFHSAHNGRLIRYNDEERGKAEIAHALARVQRLREQSIFLLRRFRPAQEILTLSPDTLWRRAESSAEGPTAEAERVLRELAIPTQKRGSFRDAIALAERASQLLAVAETAVNAALAVEEAERQFLHLHAGSVLIKDLRTNAPALDPEFEAARQLLTAARQAAATNGWQKVAERCAEAHRVLDAVAERLSQAWGGPVGKLDAFPEDRFGWLNARALMGNDPAQWEFSVLDSGASWIDLRGIWLFRVDPPNQGEQLAWPKPDISLDGWRPIKVPSPWEREGVRAENDFSPWDCPYALPDPRCDDKPYNGYAWYRRTVWVPQRWERHRLTLRVGKVSNWLRVFVNGTPVGEGRRDGGTFTLPTELVRPGALNTIALQVYNHDNFGGITDGPVALSIDDYQPASVTTPGPLSFTIETEVRAPRATARFVAFASAMSPGVVIAWDQAVLHLWGWEAKGFAPPRSIAYLQGATQREVLLDKPGEVASGTELGSSWLFLRGGTNRTSSIVTNSRPVFLVLEKRPETIRWGTNELGFAELTLFFPEPGGRMIVFALNLDEVPWTPAEAVTRAQVLRAVPVACSEFAQLDKEKLQGRFYLQYHYVGIPDFLGTPPIRAAPVPMLLSYGLAHSFPGLSLKGPVWTSYRSEHAVYGLVMGTGRLSYATPLIDKSKLLKGVGELFAKQKPEHNSRGGNTETQMFDDWKAWGFDHARYAFAWNQSWDIPLQKGLGGAINEDPQLWERMDALVKQHTDRGIQAMLCYFFNEDQPRHDSRNLVRNSTRYWRMHPEVRTNCYALWRRIAQRYKDLPSGTVAYDFFNEPAYMWQEDWNQIIKDLTRIVREVDSQHLIVVEAGDGWSQPQWFHWLEPTGDTNTIYSFHHYGKHWGYHYDEYYPGYQSTPERQIETLLEVILFGLRHHVPLHCGEFGVSMISPGEDHQVWLDDYLALLERFGIGWNWWNWSGTDIYRTGLKAGQEVSPNLAVLQKWIERKKTWK